MAQNPLKLEDVVKGSLIQTQYFGAVNWLKDGERYTQVEKNADGADEIVAYQAKSGQREVLIPASKLKRPDNGQPLKVRSIQWSKDDQKVLIYTNTKRVWRYDTRGDYWLLSLKTGSLRQLGSSFPESTLMFAKFSPDAANVAYVCLNNIYVESTETSEKAPTALTTNGGAHLVNGTFDWVYEEEFDCRDGFRWSSDSKWIAYWQSNTEGTGVFDIIDNIDSIYPTITHFPYPKAGTTNSAVKVGYVAATGGTTQWIDVPGDPRENYVPRMDFVPGTNELFIQQMNRAQNTNHIWTVEIGKTTPKNIFTDTDSAWLDTNDHIVWLKNNSYFTWESERDGWRHLYRISRDGKKIIPITKGNFDVVSLVGTDLAKGLVYFIASPTNATQRYLYTTKLFGNGTAAKQLSPVNEQGQHKYQMSPTGRWAVHTFSNAKTPPTVNMVAFPGHKSTRILVDNNKAKLQYEALGLQKKEFFKVSSGDLQLDAWMIKPAHFDASKKYPVIIEVYGEPAGSTVQDVWQGGDLWPQYMAGEGYLMVSIDNRGAMTPRGRKWRKCIYGEVGTMASEDQARGAEDLCKQFSFADSSRIGITGWSGGGSQTLNCMFRYPNIFKTGIAIAFVADQRLYDTVYQERYMNTPQVNPNGYRLGSPITWAEGLKGNLLLIHGTGDDNVHYQNCEMLVNKLVEYDKIFYQISYPMRTHSINERSGTTLHLRRTMANFWHKNL